MKVIIKEPRKTPEWVEIENSLEELQRIVDGYIETVTVTTDVCIICNEEGRINDLPYNCTLLGIQLFGNIIIAGVDGDRFCNLDEEAGGILLGGIE